MGGGGSYYDRDTYRTSRTSSSVAEERMRQRRVNPAMDPKDRKVSTDKRSPLVIAFDVTGSMGTFPKVIYDKMPMIAGQIQLAGYLEDPAICVAAVGDVVSDQGPIQIADFDSPRKLDQWLERIWLEGNGGGQAVESYEFMAYFFAKNCEMPNAVEPILIFIGDEGFRSTLSASELKEHFGGSHEGTKAKAVFKELLEKFRGNVFLVKKPYGGGDGEITREWQEALGKERVLPLGGDEKAIGDIVLGIVAIRTGRRTLDEFCAEMRDRVDVNTGKPDPQSEKRINQVRAALQPLLALEPMQPQGGKTAPKAKKPKAAAAKIAVKTSKKADDGDKKPRKPKPGRF